MEVMSLEVLAKSVETVAETQSSKQRILNFRDATEKLRAPNAVHANETVSK